MKKLLTLAALTLALTSCAPVAQLLQPKERATLTRETGALATTLLLTNPGPDALTGDPTREGDGPALTVSGTDLRPDQVAQTWCRTNAERTRLSCNLPNVPAGQRLRLLLMGQVQDGGVIAYRPSLGPRPVLVWLR
ncbi:hypothetical protein WDJ50_18360 (plasmid) [Deinococcus sp. VB142]|uniref:Lipoprotein n=1 Tax=Deinococcus sp. VB142 TaxID=3112952 RepID=A0AAU6Q8W0_9DEIO